MLNKLMTLQKKLININNFDAEKLLITKPEINGYHRVDIYYNSLQKIWIKTPKLKVSFIPNLTTHEIGKKINITLSLNPITPEIAEFYKLIFRIEKSIKNIFSELKSGFKTSINKSDYKMYVNIPCSNINDVITPNINIYSFQNKLIKLNDIPYNDTISCFLELSYVWIDNDKFGIHWSVLQIKHYPVMDFINCVFTDSDTETNIPPQQQKITKTIVPPPPPPISLKFIPTCDELIKMKQKLKSN